MSNRASEIVETALLTIFFFAAIVYFVCFTLLSIKMFLDMSKSCNEKCGSESMVATGMVGEKCVCESAHNTETVNFYTRYEK